MNQCNLLSNSSYQNLCYYCAVSSSVHLLDFVITKKLNINMWATNTLVWKAESCVQVYVSNPFWVSYILLHRKKRQCVSCWFYAIASARYWIPIAVIYQNVKENVHCSVLLKLILRFSVTLPFCFWNLHVIMRVDAAQKFSYNVNQSIKICWKIIETI